MLKSKWYLSTWFIAVLFAFWFLVIPLFVGIRLLSLQTRERVANNKHMRNRDARELRSHSFESERLQEELKQAKVRNDKELSELEEAHRLKLSSVLKTRELELSSREIEIERIEKQIDYQLNSKRRKLVGIEIAQLLRSVSMRKTRELETVQWEINKASKINELENTLQEKRLLLEKMEKEHKRKLELLTSARENELKRREVLLESREEELETRSLAKQQELERLEKEHMRKLDLLTEDKEKELKSKEDSLKAKEIELIEIERSHLQKLELFAQEKENELVSRENVVTAKEQEMEHIRAGKRKELESLEVAHQERLIRLTNAREEDLFTREKSLSMLEELATEREEEAKRLEQEIITSRQSIAILKSQIISLDDELLYQSFGFYETRYDLESSDEYKLALEKVRSEQKKLVKEKRAASTFYKVPMDANRRESIQLAIRSFNNECDTIISKVRFNNIEASEKRIRSSYHLINDLNKKNHIELSEEFLSLKLEEMFLAYEYSNKKQEEREEQRRINELMREERRAQEELEAQLSILEKEEQHLENALKRSSQFSEEMIRDLKSRLEQILRQKEDVDYRIKNTKAGYVYVISNLGSFGENVYKIGMTRRLDPMDRVRELGGASVPFRYDVHTVIFSDNAPELEAALHRTFSHRRVNKINERKEFFRVTLGEIKHFVQQNHNAVIEFTMLAEAQEYRETKLIEKQLDPDQQVLI